MSPPPRHSSLVTRHSLLLLLLASLLLSLLLSWPLPRYFARAIPYTAFEQNPDQPPTVMVPGDHLQFLYHMWLAQDTLFGPTPFFHNLYEFNAGDDSARREPSTYYLPFSLLFAAASLPFGRAAGWNFALFATIALTALASRALARRLGASPLHATLLGLIPAAFPFTWVNLLSGSPTGFAMLWVPLLFLGIDLWVADRSPAGAALAGAAVFFSEWADTHVFFFSVLVFPFWALFCHARRRGLRVTLSDLLSLLRSAWPLFLFAALAALKAWGVSRGLQSSSASAGRPLGEVAALSVPLSSLLTSGGVSKIYVGPLLLAVYLVLCVLAVLRLRRAPRSPAAWSTLALLLAIAAIVALSAGTCNPFGPRAWALLCRLIPPYAMIRQADKICCLLPALFMTALAMALPPSESANASPAVPGGAGGSPAVPGGAGGSPAASVPSSRPSRSSCASRGSRPLASRVSRLASHPTLWLVLVLLFTLFSSAFRFVPGLTLLHRQQLAYAAVAADAAARDLPPRAVVLPIWPGNSHMSSIYQCDATLYRIRILNGYRPTAQNDYLASVFRPLDSLNLGYPSPAQLALLAQYRIDYLLFDENSFPEKVSSFPPGFTLLNLLSHPRLRLLARDGAVWAFRILPESVPPGGAGDPPASGAQGQSPPPLQSPIPPVPGVSDVPFLPAPLPVLFPVRTWNWKNSENLPPDATTLPEPAASSDRVLRLSSPTPSPIPSRWIRATGPGPWTWLARVRGNATVRWTFLCGTESPDDPDTILPDPAYTTTLDTPISSPDWQWLPLPIPPVPAVSGVPAVPGVPAVSGVPAPPDLFTLTLTLLSGSADFDAVLLTRHPCPFAAPLTAPLTLPALAFFRAGFADPSDGSVLFDPAATPTGEMLYSRNLPLLPGNYRLTLSYTVPPATPPGTPLGSLRLYPDPDAPPHSTPILAPPASGARGQSPRPLQTATLDVSIPASRFPRIAVHYTRAAPLTLHSLTLEPLP